MKLKLINKPAKQNRGMNIPLGDYLYLPGGLGRGAGLGRTDSFEIAAIPVIKAFCASAPASGWIYALASQEPLASSLRNGYINGEALSAVLTNSKAPCIDGYTSLTQGRPVKSIAFAIFILQMNYKGTAFVLLLVRIHKHCFYIANLINCPNFANRRCCHA
jgi:hypothetical protein